MVLECVVLRKMRIAVFRVWYWDYEPKLENQKKIVLIFKVVIVCFQTRVPSHLQNFFVNTECRGPASDLRNLNLTLSKHYWPGAEFLRSFACTLLSQN